MKKNVCRKNNFWKDYVLAVGFDNVIGNKIGQIERPIKLSTTNK